MKILYVIMIIGVGLMGYAIGIHKEKISFHDGYIKLMKDGTRYYCQEHPQLDGGEFEWCDWMQDQVVLLRKTPFDPDAPEGELSGEESLVWFGEANPVEWLEKFLNENKKIIQAKGF